MIEEVKEFFGDVKDSVGDKGFYIIIAVLIGIFIYNLLKDDSPSEYVSATGYASYPDASENATQIVDELSQEIWASNDQVVGAIQTSESEIIQAVDDNADKTNDYVNEGLQKQEVIYEYVQAPQQTQLDHISYVYEQAKNVVENNTTQFQKVPDNLDNIVNTYNQAKANVSTQTTNFTKVTNTPPKTSTTKTSSPKKTTTTTRSPKKTTTTSTSSPKKTTTTTSSPKKTTSSPKSTSTKSSSTKSSSTKSSSTYTYKTASGLNTSTSIVDALKATGANSSMSARKEIAQANGIKNYTGTASQNTQLLNKLKSGTLKKA